jgi:hypothetical protein
VSDELTFERARTRAAEILRSGEIGSHLVRDEGKIEEPIPVLDPDRRADSWFIGISVGGKLAGFVQLGPDMGFLRYSSFQRDPRTLEGCPPSSSWLDVERILALARSRAAPEDLLETPYLTFDKSPSRIVWAVEAIDQQRHKTTIYVAGEHVYTAKEE